MCKCVFISMHNIIHTNSHRFIHKCVSSSRPFNTSAGDPSRSALSLSRPSRFSNWLKDVARLFLARRMEDSKFAPIWKSGLLECISVKHQKKMMPSKKIENLLYCLLDSKNQ